MSQANQWSYSTATTENLLVIFTDWKNFVPFSRSRNNLEVFEALDDFYRLSDQHISQNGGLPLKYMGDSSIAVFKAVDADRGIMSMFDFKNAMDQWFKKKGFNCSLYVNCHFGEVVIGPMGNEKFQKIDIVGQTVNVCATLGKKNFLLSPQAFRCLSSENRKHFKKFTPPITYSPTSFETEA